MIQFAKESRLPKDVIRAMEWTGATVNRVRGEPTVHIDLDFPSRAFDEWRKFCDEKESEIFLSVCFPKFPSLFSLPKEDYLIPVYTEVSNLVSIYSSISQGSLETTDLPKVPDNFQPENMVGGMFPFKQSDRSLYKLFERISSGEGCTVISSLPPPDEKRIIITLFVCMHSTCLTINIYQKILDVRMIFKRARRPFRRTECLLSG
jgi:hypothetical protein